MPRTLVRALCDALEAAHGVLRDRLTDLDGRIQAAAPDPRLAAPWAHFIRGLRAHLAEEELVLFPALRSLARGVPVADPAFRSLLAELGQELDEIATISDALRNAARDAGPLEADILALLDELETHARREQDELLPAALDLLAAAPAMPSAAADASAADASAPSSSPSSSPVASPPFAPRPQGSVLRRTAHKLRDLLRR